MENAPFVCGWNVDFLLIASFQAVMKRNISEIMYVA